MFPPGFRRLHKFIYPYLEPKSIKDLKAPLHGAHKYPIPEHPPSPAGGGQGGNPSLWDIHAQVNVSITNRGSHTGKEVVQLYVSFPAETAVSGHAVGFPVKVLRAFYKVDLQPNESEVVTFHLTRKDLSFWSTVDQNWVMPTQGKFKLWVGNSSRHLPMSAEL